MSKFNLSKEAARAIIDNYTKCNRVLNSRSSNYEKDYDKLKDELKKIYDKYEVPEELRNDYPELIKLAARVDNSRNFSERINGLFSEKSQ